MDKDCPGAVVAALILYTDATTLSNDMRVSGWPLVMSLGNIAREKRKDVDGHGLLAVFPILSAHPGFQGKLFVLPPNCRQKSFS